MSKNFKIVDNDISDGYHTFDQLYAHRCLLFLNLCLNDKENVFWKPDYEDWFCLYWESPVGQISYHLPLRYMPLVQRTFTRDDDHKWDGHTSDDSILRLTKIAYKDFK